MAIKISISLPEETMQRIDSDTVNLRLKNPRKYVSFSAVINAHLKRSFTDPLEVTV